MLIIKMILLTLIFHVVLCEANQNRIIGGWPAKLAEFPFQVSIRRSYNNAHFCSGIILDAYHILTAAHCMFYQWGGILTPTLITISAGQNGLNLTETSVIRNVSMITIHPKFNKKTLDNDIAIIKLAENLPINHENIDTISFNNGVLKSNRCTISGWGVQHTNFQQFNPISNELLVTEVKIMETLECNRKYAKVNLTLPEGGLCAENINETIAADACQGDSGGPLICNNTTLIGIISAGIGCGDVNYPGVYMNVSYYSTWIKNILIDQHLIKFDKFIVSNYWNNPLIGKSSTIVNNFVFVTFMIFLSINILN